MLVEKRPRFDGQAGSPDRDRLPRSSNASGKPDQARHRRPYPDPVNFAFSGELWFWKGPAPWHFVTVPDDQVPARSRRPRPW